MGKQVSVTAARYSESTPHSFLATAVWVVPVMVVLLIGGFMLGGLVVGKYLDDKGEVKVNLRAPVRILTPSEAQAAAKDQASPVWEEGVDRSTLPKMDPPEEQGRRATPKKAAPKSAAGATTEANPSGITDRLPADDSPSASDASPDAGGNEIIPPD